MARTAGCDVIHSGYHDRHAIVDQIGEGNKPSSPRPPGGYRATLRRFSSLGGGSNSSRREADGRHNICNSLQAKIGRGHPAKALKPLSALARKPARLTCRHPLPYHDRRLPQQAPSHDRYSEHDKPQRKIPDSRHERAVPPTEGGESTHEATA